MGRTLLELLPRLAARTRIVALVDARRPVPDLGVPVEAVRAPLGVPRLGWLELAVGPWMDRQPGVLLHGAAYALPVRRRGPAVVTLYDVAWETHPRDFSPWKRRAWQLSARRSVAAAGAVITVSEFSRKAIVDTYGLDPASVIVTPCAVGSAFRGHEARPIPNTLGLPPRYVVALGGAARRDLPMAVEAWRRAVAQLRRGGGADDVGLAVVGSQPPAAEPGITWLGALDDVTWAAVLAGAEAFLYPTSHEGFGLPAAEASASGTPVVCARVASLPEVLGDGAAWASRLDADALGGALASLLGDPARRAEMAAAALAHCARAPTWDDAADLTIRAYELARHREVAR